MALNEHSDAEQVAAVATALGAIKGDPLESVRAFLANHSGSSIGAAWLRAIIGEATDSDVNTIATATASAPSGRVHLAAALHLVADRVAAPALAAAINNIEWAVPFAPVVLGAGRAALHITGDAKLAATLDVRADFIQRHAAVIDRCQSATRERQRDAAVATLMAMTGDDITLGAYWLEAHLKEANARARAWAVVIVAASPTLSAVAGAAALMRGKLDEHEQKKLCDLIEPERAIALLVCALAKGWAQSAITLAHCAPMAFRDADGFAALDRLLEKPAANTYIIRNLFGSVTHRWAKHLTNDQAAAIARRMVVLLGDDECRKDVNNACNYFAHPGGVPVWREALASPTTIGETRKSIYAAVHSTPGQGAEDLLIDQLFAETEQRRDLVFAFHYGVPASRHPDILARIVATRSLEAAWMYTGCQIHWAHRPRAVVEIAEHVRLWPTTNADDQSRHAGMMSAAVRAAIELHRYESARTYLQALGNTTMAADPTKEKLESTVLADDKMAEVVAALRAKHVDEEDAKTAELLAKARKNGKPFALNDNQLGFVIGGAPGWILHRDANSHEVWGFDKEGVFFCTDGFGLASPPFTLFCFAPGQAYDVSIPELATYCEGFEVDERNLQRSDASERVLLRSSNKVLLRFTGSLPVTTWWPIGLTFSDAAAASRAFAALAASPLSGSKTVDPFYTSGKDGGAAVYEYGNQSEYGFVVDGSAYWGPDKHGAPQTFPNRADAVAWFDAQEVDALRRGLIPRAIDTEERVRSIEDTPLSQWLANRAWSNHQSGAWHIEGVAAMRAALDSTGIDFEHELSAEPPATAAMLDSYDETLPEPMPDEMRAMWLVARSVQWRIGKQSMRLLSPSEVVAGRAIHRAALACHRFQNFSNEAEHLDVLVVADDVPMLSFDVRQLRVRSWLNGDACERDLGDAVGAQLLNRFVGALVKLYPQLKKLNMGQSIADQKPKKKPTSKAKSKAK